MRIGFDAKRAFHNSSGLGSYSRNIISRLSEFYPNNEYFLYTPRFSKAKFTDFRNQNQQVREPHHFPWNSFPSAWRSLAMGKDIEADGIQLFHGLSNELPFNIKNLKAKKIVTIHDLIFLHHPNLYKPIDRLIYRKKFRFSAEIADCVIAISHQTRNDLVQYLGIEESKIKVVYQSCNPVFSRKAEESLMQEIKDLYDLPSEFILYVGTIEERKNLLQLVKAMNEGKIDFPLVVIGRETPYAKKVYEYVAGNSMENIWFLRNVPAEHLAPIYQMARLFVYPSSYEGFGLPVLEALNSGIPVIAASGSCLEETGGKESKYVNPSNTSEISAAISEVLFSESRRKIMIEEGLKHALEFTPEKSIQNLWNVYKSLF